MYRGPVRIAVLVVGLLLTIGAGYRAFQHETSINRERQEAVAADAAVSRALELLLDIRASLHAYVAPGQGHAFWEKRAQENIDTLRQTLVSLEGVSAPVGRPLSESLDAIDQLTAAERRARTYVSREDVLLAGDVIFTEARDLIGAATVEVNSLRADLRRHHEQRASAIRTEQITLAGGAVALWIVIAMLLTPTEAKPAVKNPAEWRNELKETLAKPLRTTATPLDVPPAATPPQPPPVPQPPAEPSVRVASVKETSEICTDLSALSDPGALQATLARVSALLDATGLIVWVTSNDGTSLSPVATHGFDPTLVARIGRVPRDGANLTAAASRENVPKISAPTATRPAALAVAMCGPSGPAGVLSVELKPGQAVDEAKVALASIIAAQLATLTMPVTMDLSAAADQEPKSAAL